MAHMQIRKTAAAFVLAALLYAGTAPASMAADDKATFSDLSGTWLVAEEKNLGGFNEYFISISASGPLALIVSETGSVAFGLVLPSSNPDYVFEIFWRFGSGQQFKKFRGGVKYEPCEYGTIGDVREYLLPVSIEGDYAFPAFIGTGQKLFLAYKKYELSVTVNPKAAGTVISSDGNINTDSATAALYDGDCPPDGVTLTAAPKQGYRFKNWKAGLLQQTYTTSQLNIIIDADFKVTAVFEQESTGGGSCCFYRCRDDNKSTNKGAGYPTEDMNACMKHAEEQCAELGVFPEVYGMVNCTDCASTACFSKWEKIWQ